MALSIKTEKADRLARELAATTGESITDAVTIAIEDRLARERRAKRSIADRLRTIRTGLRDLPRLDDRSDDDIIGYDANGVPT
jgi:antitoxin VapB